jgi:tetratricopeptide (TPR) repeat protein
MNAATLGDKAAAASDWPSAIKHYTNALIELPRAPAYYIKRSTAYSRRKAPDGGPDFQAALRDAELALALARERAKREIIIDAQLRRAVVLFQLERYGDAGHLFDLLEEKMGLKKSENQEPVDKSAQVQAAMSQKGSQKQENELAIWKIKTKGKISKLEKGDGKLEVTIQEYPDTKIPSEQELKKNLKNQLGQSAKGTEGTSVASGEASVADKTTESKLNVSSSSAAPFTAGPGAPAAPAPAPAPTKVRHEWYQSQDSVVVTVYAKNVDKAQLETDLQENSVSAVLKFSRFYIS